MLCANIHALPNEKGSIAIARRRKRRWLPDRGMAKGNKHLSKSEWSAICRSLPIERRAEDHLCAIASASSANRILIAGLSNPERLSI